MLLPAIPVRLFVGFLFVADSALDPFRQCRYSTSGAYQHLFPRLVHEPPHTASPGSFPRPRRDSCPSANMPARFSPRTSPRRRDELFPGVQSSPSCPLYRSLHPELSISGIVARSQGFSSRRAGDPHKGRFPWPMQPSGFLRDHRVVLHQSPESTNGSLGRQGHYPAYDHLVGVGGARGVTVICIVSWSKSMLTGRAFRHSATKRVSGGGHGLM
jgi:hypothetical protein